LLAGKGGLSRAPDARMMTINIGSLGFSVISK